MDVFCYCLVKYVVGYIVSLDGCLDVIIFIGGIGENFVLICEMVLNCLVIFGIIVDSVVNLKVCFGGEGVIIIVDSCILVMVIVINEELVIVEDIVCLMNI